MFCTSFEPNSLNSKTAFELVISEAEQPSIVISEGTDIVGKVVSTKVITWV